MGGGRMTGRPGLSLVGKLLAGAALWCFAALALSFRGPHHAWSGIYMTEVILLVLFAKLLARIPLSVSSCFLLLPALLLEMLLFYGPLAHSPFLVLFFLTDCCLLLYGQKRSLKEYYAGLSVTAFAGVFLLSGYEFLAEKLIPFYFVFSGRLELGTLSRISLILGFGICFLFLFLAALRLFGRLFRKWDQPLGYFSERFSGLELYVFLVVVFAVFLTIFTESGYVLSGAYSYMSWRMFWFQIFFLFMGVVYLALLAKVLSIKEKMAEAKRDRDLVFSYSEVLERNMDSLREIRHDTKNLFLSMGGFVERCWDAQMKAFYREQIVPFMEDTLVKSDLQEKLKYLEDIPLKAFLYYKIAEKLKGGIPVHLELSEPVSVGTDFGDLVRLLGILIDNGAEEAALIGGTVRICIGTEDFGVRFRIANSVRPQVKEQGIRPGKSEKGPGRGRGLLIAERILAGNGQMFLNSYFAEEEFVQALMVRRRPQGRE